MQSYGADQVRRGSGDQWILLCPRSKGWVARTPATMIARDRPGTAVLWGERYFEVIVATSSGPRVRYVLEPWRDEDVMRVVDGYDEASEARRDADHRENVSRELGRKTANLLGVLTGHLPAPVQERLGNEVGILPSRLTLVSILLPLAFIALVLNEWVRRKMADEAQIPLWLVLLAGYLLLESGIRMQLALSQSRPVGSAAGLIVYTLFYLVAPNRRGLVKPVQIAAPAIIDAAPDVALQDAYTLREPLLTLLAPAEQRLLAERFGFDYRRQSRAVAFVIFAFSSLGIVTSVATLREAVGLSALLSLVAAAGLAVEQVMRLGKLRRGPAGSILGTVVRLFSKKLLA